MNDESRTIAVRVYNKDGTLYRRYLMDHNDKQERVRLGEGCRDAFSAGQAVLTAPVGFSVTRMSKVHVGETVQYSM